MQMTATLSTGLLDCYINLPSKISTKQRYVPLQTSSNHFRTCCVQVKLSCRGWFCVFSASCVLEINHSGPMSWLVLLFWQGCQFVLHLVITTLSTGQWYCFMTWFFQKVCVFMILNYEMKILNWYFKRSNKYWVVLWLMTSMFPACLRLRGRNLSLAALF